MSQKGGVEQQQQKKKGGGFSFRSFQKLLQPQRGGLNVRTPAIKEEGDVAAKEQQSPAAGFTEPVFDIEGCDVCKQDSCLHGAVCMEVEQALSATCPFADKVRDCLLEHEEQIGFHLCSMECMATALQEKGYSTKQITNYGGGVDLWNRLKHTFMLVYSNDKDSSKIIVDANFQSHFHIAKPSDRYRRILNLLPAVYIGNHQKLNELISILVKEMQLSFKQQGRSIPPWRSLVSLQSKWKVSKNNHYSPESLKQFVINNNNKNSNNNNNIINKIDYHQRRSSSMSFWRDCDNDLEIQIKSVNSFSGTSVSSELSALLRENSRTSGIFERTMDISTLNNNNNKNCENNQNGENNNIEGVFQQ